jgi:geranylgeranyl diphosphate synthase type II
MNVEDIVQQKKLAIDRELESVLSRDDSLLFQAMRYAVLSGGKRFRPLLMLAVGECFGFNMSRLLPVACAVELIHNYSLVHDDLPVMDDDDFRRNKPTCHKAYGEDIALLAGDGLLTLAFEILGKTPLDDEQSDMRGEVIAQVSQDAGAEGMVGGQVLDLTLSSETIAPEEYYTLISKKTGALIMTSVRVGAMIAKASSEDMKAIIEYGRYVGLAFQTRDDILDADQDNSDRAQVRPNSVALFGLEEAKRKLAEYVNLALAALDKIPYQSEELRYLAKKLLNVKKGKQNESNS